MSYVEFSFLSSDENCALNINKIKCFCPLRFAQHMDKRLYHLIKTHTINTSSIAHFKMKEEKRSYVNTFTLKLKKKKRIQTSGGIRSIKVISYFVYSEWVRLISRTYT